MIAKYEETVNILQIHALELDFGNLHPLTLVFSCVIFFNKLYIFL